MNIWLWHGSTLRQTYKISSKFFVVKFFLSWYICLYVCMYMLTHVCRHQQRPDKNTESPGAILQEAESLPEWVLGTNSSLLQNQLVPASLQPLSSTFEVPLYKISKFNKTQKHQPFIRKLGPLLGFNWRNSPEGQCGRTDRETAAVGRQQRGRVTDRWKQVKERKEELCQQS